MRETVKDAMLMKSPAMQKAVYAVSGLLFLAGMVLYLGTYFIGLGLMAAGLVVIALRTLLARSREELLAQAGRFGRVMVIPAAGIGAAIVIGGVVMAVTGYNPFEAYGALFYGGFVRNWHVSILNACPLIFTGLSVAFAFKAGLFNIGAEGQYYVGAMTAALLGYYLHLPGILAVILIFIAAGAAGAVYNYIPALLKVKTGAHEVITTMMFAHVARYSSSIFIRSMGGNPETSSHPYVTWPIQESSYLPRFKDFLPQANYRLHIGILIGVAVAAGVYYLLFRTRIGYEIRAVGYNATAARVKGISPGKNIYRALLGAGALAAFAGVGQVLGLDHKLFENLQAGYGWNGISVALLASNHPAGVVLTALLWGALDAGGQYMSRTVHTPNSIVEIIKGIVLFLVVARYIYTYIGNRLQDGERFRLRRAVAIARRSPNGSRGEPS